MLPSLPTIPTDSLHRFLAITGLLMMTVPTLYLSNRAEGVKERVIHLEAEKKIIEIQNKAVVERQTVLFARMIGKDIRNMSPSKVKIATDSVLTLKKFVNISYDSVDTEIKVVQKLFRDQEIAKVHLDEKDNIIKFNIERIEWYVFNTKVFGFIGAILACFGFIRWYNKES